MLYIIVISALLAASCLWLIIRPFFLPAAQAESFTAEGFDLETVYETVNDLEMDALMSKISIEDFTHLKDACYRAAASAIEQKDEADSEIESALYEIRAERPA